MQGVDWLIVVEFIGQKGYRMMRRRHFDMFGVRHWLRLSLVVSI